MITHSLLLVLKAFLEQPSPLSGADVLRTTGVRSGTLYPILLRLESRGVLKSKWEAGKPEKLGRPRRRFYTLTPKGTEFAKVTLASVRL